MESMEFINKLKADYASKTNHYDTEKDKIEKKIARLQKKLSKMERPHWTDHQVRPIIEEVARRTPDITWEKDKTLHTFGLRCECSFFGKTADGHTVAITLTPGRDIPHYDTGEYHNKFRIRTLGDMNGFNNVSKPVESIDELIALIRKQEQEAILCHRRTSIENAETDE